MFWDLKNWHLNWHFNINSWTVSTLKDIKDLYCVMHRCFSGTRRQHMRNKAVSFLPYFGLRNKCLICFRRIVLSCFGVWLYTAFMSVGEQLNNFCSWLKIHRKYNTLGWNKLCQHHQSQHWQFAVVFLRLSDFLTHSFWTMLKHASGSGLFFFFSFYKINK